MALVIRRSGPPTRRRTTRSDSARSGSIPMRSDARRRSSRASRRSRGTSAGDAGSTTDVLLNAFEDGALVGAAGCHRQRTILDLT
jgi:hypothetical protein